MKSPFYSLRRRYLKKHGKVGVFQAFGLRWLLDPQDAYDRQIILGSAYEEEARTYLRKRLREHKPNRFFDIGANFGLYSVYLVKALPDLRMVHAYEPVSRIYTKLRTNVLLNGVEDRIFPHMAAVGETPGQGEIAIVPNSSGASMLSSHERQGVSEHFDIEHPDVSVEAFTNQQSVKIVSLDSDFDITGERLAFKIDVEGHELNALKGMQRLLRSNECFLQIECFETHAVDAFLQELGYREEAAIGPDHFYCKG